MRTLLVPPVVLALLVGLVLPAGAQSEVQAILDKAIQAHGGAERLAKPKARQTKSKGTLEVAGGITFTQDSSTQLPNQLKEVMQLNVNGQNVTVITVFNGTQGWINANGQTSDMDDKVLAELKEALHLIHLSRLTNLRDKMYELSPLGELPVEGRTTLGIKVAAKGHRDVQLYFDKETGLLTRIERRVADSARGQEVTEERIVKDYQEADGIKLPRKALINRDGKKFMELEIVETKSVDKIDDREFAKP
jgi:hypothetical protein